MAGMTYDLARDYDDLGVGRGRSGPPIVTACTNAGRCGMFCPICMGTHEIAASSLGAVISCVRCGAPLKINAFATELAWRESGPIRLSQHRHLARVEFSEAMSDFADFVRERAYVLNEWPETVFQEAANRPHKTAPTRLAKTRMESGQVPPWFQLSQQHLSLSSPLMTLAAHSADVVTCCYSQDGTRIFSASRDCTARIWNASVGNMLATLAGHSKDVVALAYSASLDRIVSASYDCSLKLWNGSTGQAVGTLAGHEQKVTCAGVLARRASGSLRIVGRDP